MHAKQSSCKTGDFEVSVMAGYKYCRTIIQEILYGSVLVWHVHMFAPIRAMDLSWSVSNLADHQQQMVPHLSTQERELIFRESSVGQLQVAVDNLSTNFQPIRQNHGKQSATPITSFKRCTVD